MNFPRKPARPVMVSRYFLILLLASAVSYTFSMQDFYGPDIDNEKFTRHQSPFLLVANGSKKIELDKYFTLGELENLIFELEDNYPDIARAQDLGISVIGRELWMLRITHNITQERKRMKPSFKFVANIHGDDAVGYALLVSLMQYLVYSDGYDERITSMLEEIDIYIIPTLNPDGFNRSKEGVCESQDGRFNANQVDLDHDFADSVFDPKFLDRQPEIRHVSWLIERYPFVLSGNLKGGAIVANDYGAVSATPDNIIFETLAKDYAAKNWMMASGNACNKSCADGIRRVDHLRNKDSNDGGMQDFNYIYSNCFEITFYLSCCKYPHAKFLPFYWHANLESMLGFIESTRRGIFGRVKDTWGRLVPDALVKVEGFGKEVTVTKKAEYWRLLTAGNYSVTASAPGYEEQTREVEVTEENYYVRLDFALVWKSILRKALCLGG